MLDYQPFGSIRLDEKTGNFNERKKFTGHEYDADTGLNYMKARYQSGRVGRFISVDPLISDIGINGQLFKQRYSKGLNDVLGNTQSLNSYSYTLNNPIIYNDPDGKDFEISISGTAWGFSGATGIRFGLSGLNFFYAGGFGAGTAGLPISLSYTPGEISHQTEVKTVVGGNVAYWAGYGGSKDVTCQSDVFDSKDQSIQSSLVIGVGADAYVRKEKSIPIVGGNIPVGLELKDTSGGFSTPNYVIPLKEKETIIRSAGTTTTINPAKPKPANNTIKPSNNAKIENN